MTLKDLQQNTLSEFDNDFPVSLFMTGGYMGAEGDAIRKQTELRAFISKHQERAVREVYHELESYIEHSRDCILSWYEAGRPTEDGGYEQKIKGKWYQSRPVDETPKCDCGLQAKINKFLDTHEHKWTDAINEVVKSGEVCLECGAVR
jgi:hypothetical protein